MAACLRLAQADALAEGSHYGYKYKGHSLHVRVNAHGEIDHIGLLLFPAWYRLQTSPTVCDFLERNLLERLLPMGEEARFRQAGEHVSFIKGSAQTALTLDTTDITGVSEERIDFKVYRVCWERQQSEVLKICFDMDYQMLTGCNSQELEERYLRQLRRFKPHKYVARELPFPKHTNVYVAAGDTFQIKEMRNDLYYERDSRGWHLTNSGEAASNTLRNMMLSIDFTGNPTLELTLDKFGYQTETITVPYKNWLQMGIDEGCTPFFGVKRRTDAAYEGTVLMVNPREGYVHLLSVEVPLETIGGANAVVKGRLYVYNPMHNLSKDYFK